MHGVKTAGNDTQHLQSEVKIRKWEISYLYIGKLFN